MKMQNTHKGAFHRSLNSGPFSSTCFAKDGMSGMFLKKVEGPRTVTLPDGSTMSRADLPPVTTKRWVASRKVAVVKGVAAGLITRAEACDMYDLSEEELESWFIAVRSHGEKALKATQLMKYRQS